MTRLVFLALLPVCFGSITIAEEHTEMTDLLRIYEVEQPPVDTRGFIAQVRSENTLYHSGESPDFDPIYCLDSEHALTIPGLADGGILLGVEGAGSAAVVSSSPEAEGALALVDIDGDDVLVHIAQRAPETTAIVTATNTRKPTNVDITQDTAAAIVDVCIDGPHAKFDFTSDNLTAIDVLSGPDGQNIFVRQ